MGNKLNSMTYGNVREKYKSAKQRFENGQVSTASALIISTIFELDVLRMRTKNTGEAEKLRYIN
jgi:hypothetical protein